MCGTLRSSSRGSWKCHINLPKLFIFLFFFPPSTHRWMNPSRGRLLPPLSRECSHHVYVATLSHEVCALGPILRWHMGSGCSWCDPPQKTPTASPLFGTARGASLCRLADSCLCSALTWQPGSECWPYAPIVNSSQMPSKQKPKTSKEFI